MNSNCPSGEGPEICGDGVDNNHDGCVDEGCVIGEGACTCVGQCSSLSCSPPGTATCNPYNGQREICGDGIDNNCNGLVDEGCTPPKRDDACAETAGSDPLLLASRSAVTEPFTDFSVDTGLLQLALTRTYASNDWAYEGGPGGAFGRGWCAAPAGLSG